MIFPPSLFDGWWSNCFQNLPETIVELSVVRLDKDGDCMQLKATAPWMSRKRKEMRVSVDSDYQAEVDKTFETADKILVSCTSKLRTADM